MMKSFPLMSMFLLVLLVFAGAHVYVFWRLWMLTPAAWLRVAIVVMASVLTATFFVGMLTRNANVPAWIVGPMQWTGTAWVMVFFYLVMAFLAIDLLRLAHILPSGVLTHNWLTFSALTIALTAIFVTGNIVYHHKRRVEIELKADIERPLTIVAASDLHLGSTIGRKELARWVDMINAERPDAVVFAGDVVDNSVKPLWQSDMAAEFRRLDAPWGVFAAPGNHEYIAGIDSCLQFMKHAAIRPLRDSTATIAGGVVIVGRDDESNHNRMSVKQLTASIFADQTTILLDHQPHNLQEAADAGISLQLSGHTHRGQIWPATWLTDRLFERSHGALTKDGTQFYVMQGLGIWGGKFRIGSRSEYVVVKLIPKAAK